jgi:mRNA-degrading endonuclease RelE of RelBE toxin-antitoxin system
VSYSVWVRPQALKEITGLPGNLRNRVRRAIDGLAHEPRPSESVKLRPASASGVTEAPEEARRLRLDNWRIV